MVLLSQSPYKKTASYSLILQMVLSNNTFEEITLADNATQLIGSSNGNVTMARRIAVDSRAVQCLGDFADSTVQQIIKGRSHHDVRTSAGRGVQNVPQATGRKFTGNEL